MSSGTFSCIFSPVCQTCHLGVQREISRKTVFSEKKLFYIYFRIFGQKVFTLLAFFFISVVKFVIHASRGTIWRKLFIFFWNFKSLIFSRFLAKNFPNNGKCFFAGLSKLHSKCPEELFQKYFCRHNSFISFFGFWTKSSRITGLSLAAALWNLPSACLEKCFEETFAH